MTSGPEGDGILFGLRFPRLGWKGANLKGLPTKGTGKTYRKSWIAGYFWVFSGYSQGISGYFSPCPFWVCSLVPFNLGPCFHICKFGAFSRKNTENGLADSARSLLMAMIETSLSASFLSFAPSSSNKETWLWGNQWFLPDPSPEPSPKRPREFPNPVVSKKLVCNLNAEALFCALLRTCVCALLRPFACFCVRLRLERPRLGTAERSQQPS